MSKALYRKMAVVANDNLAEQNRLLKKALQDIVADWDDNSPEIEVFNRSEYGDYWSPAASLIHSKFISAARQLLLKLS